MLRFCKSKSKLLFAALLPMDPKNYDTISKESETAKKFTNRLPSSETGGDRLKKMFQLDENENISSELNSIYQAGFLGFLIGAIYGGIVNSRTSYMDFMESNQATAFKSHLDAKRKLQDQFTVSFAKGAFKWGWRLGLFTTSYVGIITCISVYREKSSIYEYLAAGSITGTFYKISLGPRAMLVGGLLGGALGGIAGGLSLGLMKISGTSMEEVRYWQYKWKLERDASVQEALKSQSEPDPQIMILHDQKVGNEISLNKV